MADLKKGSKGSPVKDLQKQLNKQVKPKPPLALDGIFGEQTEKAVKTYQKKNRLKASGVADAATLAALSGKTSAAAAGGKKGNRASAALLEQMIASKAKEANLHANLEVSYAHIHRESLKKVNGIFKKLGGISAGIDIAAEIAKTLVGIKTDTKSSVKTIFDLAKKIAGFQEQVNKLNSKAKTGVQLAKNSLPAMLKELNDWAGALTSPSFYGRAFALMIEGKSVGDAVHKDWGSEHKQALDRVKRRIVADRKRLTQRRMQLRKEIAALKQRLATAGG